MTAARITANRRSLSPRCAAHAKGRQPFDLHDKALQALLDDSLGDSRGEDERPLIGPEFASENVTEAIVRLPVSRHGGLALAVMHRHCQASDAVTREEGRA